MQVSSMLLTDLLPSFFDSVVLRLTGRGLLKAERDAILAALVNCVGESVMRRVRAKSYGSNIDTIATEDHFSDQWISRPEIIDTIKKSSGLNLELSEFALFLLEACLDLNAADEGITIREIGSFMPLEPTDLRGSELENFLQHWLSYFDEYRVHSALANLDALRSLYRWLPWQLNPLRILLRPQPHDKKFFRDMLETSARIRLRLPYQITLSEDLAYKQRDVSYSVVEIRPTVDNTFRVRRR